MELSINTPALLFPAISLVMLAYTNRFLALSNRVRTLHDKYREQDEKGIIHGQIKNLRYRLKLIKHMQTLGVLSFLFCIACMFFYLPADLYRCPNHFCHELIIICSIPVTFFIGNPAEYQGN